MKAVFPWAVAVLAQLSLLSGCAGITVEGIGGKSQIVDTAASGVRFYQEAPFLFVYPDGKGGIACEVKWLPDTTQLMSARPYSFLAKNESTLEFTASALTSATITVDETDVVKASLEALGKVLAANTKEGAEAKLPAPKLYRIIVDGGKSKIGLSDSETLDTDGKPIVISITLPSS